MNFDSISTLLMVGVGASCVLAYIIRILVKGRAHFDRVDRQGASSLLSKDMMEGFYWCLQPIGKLLVFFKVTPNQISWASLFFGLLAGICLAFGHFGSGAVFGSISALFDSLDGMVARLSHVASDAGEVLDAAVDRYVEFFYLGGLVIYYREVPVLMILALLAFLGSFMVSYSSAKAEALHISPPKGNMRRPERALYLLIGAGLSPVTIPWFEKVRDFSIPIGHPMVAALCLVAVLANFSAIERFWFIAKAIRIKEAEESKNKLKKTVAHLEDELESVSDDGKPLRS